jgi:hypothetical protein
MVESVSRKSKTRWLQLTFASFACFLTIALPLDDGTNAYASLTDPTSPPPKIFSDWQSLLKSSLTISKASPAVIKQLTDTRHPRYFNNCFQGRVSSSNFKKLTPCHFGDVSSKTKVVLMGDSFAGEWTPALDKLGKSMHFEVVANVRFSCSFLNIAVKSGPAAPLDSGCLSFNKAAVAYANSLNPSLVVLSQNLYRTRSDGSSLDPGGSTYARAITTSISQIHAQAKVMFFGFAFASSDPKICLSRNLTSVQNCSTPLTTSFSESWFANFSNAAKAGGAYPVGLSSLSCTTSFCPSIVGGQLVHQDQGHFMQGFALESAPVLGQLIGCASSKFTTSNVLKFLLQVPTTSAASWCAAYSERLGQP